MIPAVGIANQAVTAVTGYDVISGVRVGPLGRAFAVGGTILVLVDASGVMEDLATGDTSSRGEPNLKRLSQELFKARYGGDWWKRKQFTIAAARSGESIVFSYQNGGNNVREAFSGDQVALINDFATRFPDYGFFHTQGAENVIPLHGEEVLADHFDAIGWNMDSVSASNKVCDECCIMLRNRYPNVIIHR